MFLNDAEACITKCCSEVFNRLDAIGYGKFRKENSEQTVKLTKHNVCHSTLKKKCRGASIWTSLSGRTSEIVLKDSRAKQQASHIAPKSSVEAASNHKMSTNHFPTQKEKTVMSLESLPWQRYPAHNVWMQELSEWRKSKLYKETSKFNNDKNITKRRKNTDSKRCSANQPNSTALLTDPTFGWK